MARILVVDNEPSILSVLSTLLKAEGYEVQPMRESDRALEVVKSDESFDLMLFDLRMVPVDGMHLLREAKAIHAAVPVIILTAYASVDTAIEAMRLGAFDYVRKPFEVDELLITIQRALEYGRAIAENVDLKAQLGSRYEFANIVSESRAMKNVCEMIQRVAPTDATVLVYGESGTGKELVAKAIHAHSRRKDRKFVAVNCAALPEPLLESELFGHVKGAFTGAVSSKEGLFEVAGGGTIFLDEISGMSPNLQSKLLRVLQEREVRRVGGNETVKIDVRVIAATNVKLEDLVARQAFREDLYYRVSVIPIEIKPLRERPDDILPLVYHVLKKETPAGAEPPRLNPDVRDLLVRYSWPGNVRELENAVKHAITFARGNTISLEVLPRKLLDAVTAPLTAPLVIAGDMDCKPLRSYLREKEREYLAGVLAHFGGDKALAAKALKVSLATLYRKLPDK